MGNFEGVKNKEYLKKHNITHILSAIPEKLSKFESIIELNLIQHVIDCNDDPNFNLFDRLEEAADYIFKSI